jgi:signal transduction histidine kinase
MIALVESPTIQADTQRHSLAKSDGATRAFSAAAPEASKLGHDARNLFSALQLYSDLLAAPGVLTPAFSHYAGDLRTLGENGIRLIEGLAMAAGESAETVPLLRRRPFPGIDDLAAELLALEAPLRALAGPAVRLEVECAPCAGHLALNSEDLLRILFNLVGNSVEAMCTSPTAAARDRFLRITAQRGGGASFLARSSSDISVNLSASKLQETVVLSVRDSGPGIAAADLERIFIAGFTTRTGDCPEEEPTGGEIDAGCAPRNLHGLGLAIVRQLVEAAGGAVRAVSSPGHGARFDIELPVFAARSALQSEAGAEGKTPPD